MNRGPSPCSRWARWGRTRGRPSAPSSRPRASTARRSGACADPPRPSARPAAEEVRDRPLRPVCLVVPTGEVQHGGLHVRVAAAQVRPVPPGVGRAVLEPVEVIGRDLGELGDVVQREPVREDPAERLPGLPGLRAVRGPERSRCARESGAMLSRSRTARRGPTRRPRRKSCAARRTSSRGPSPSGAAATRQPPATAPRPDRRGPRCRSRRSTRAARPPTRSCRSRLPLAPVRDVVALGAVAAAHVLQDHRVPAGERRLDDRVLLGPLAVVRPGRRASETFPAGREPHVGSKHDAVAHLNGNVVMRRRLVGGRQVLGVCRRLER